MQTDTATIAARRAAFRLGDGRRRESRRHKELLAAFGDEVGGFDLLAPSDQQRVFRLVSMSVQLEVLDAKRARGESIDGISYLGLSNAQRRALAEFGKLKLRNRGSPRPDGREKANSKPATDGMTKVLDSFRMGEAS